MKHGLIAVLAGLAACGGGDAVDPAASDAARLLHQASFGPTAAEIERVAALGPAAWLDEQLALPPTPHRPLVDALAASGERNWTYDFRIEAWWRRVLYAPDQLRQRVAWALSQLFVISDRADAIAPDLEGLASYYDLLLEHAFGDYRALLEAVTLSPQMGGYLSMLQNQKPDPERNVYPDENYAREVMQLFSIGLVELQPDGSPRLGADGKPAATYDQRVVEGMAHAFTGWNYAQAGRWDQMNPDTRPMEPWDDYHDPDAKLLVTGHRTPGGQTARDDLQTILDLLAAHPNVGPFLGRQLIQRLVTSNPTPAYVARVAAVFDDDGAGARGNLGAVVRAILLDPEARAGHRRAPATFGKAREPIVRLTALWRAFDARSASGWVDFPWPDQILGQAPLRSPTVFNFYRPDHLPPGELSERGLAAPELALATHTYVTRVTNELLLRVRARGDVGVGRAAHEVAANLRVADPIDPPEVPGMVLDVTRELALARDDPGALAAHLALLLLGGPMSDELRALVVARIEQRDIPLEERVRDAIFLVVSAPEAVLQR